MSKSVKEFILKFIKYWLPFIIWSVVIYSFSSNPTIKASEIHWQDFIVKKSAHIFEYFVFSLLLYRLLINSKVKPDKALIISLLAALIYGLTDEFHQSFTPGREPKLRDVFIDTSGAVMFAISMKLIITKINKLRNLAKVIQLVRD